MPTSTTRPRGRVMPMAWRIDADEPRVSMVASAPPDRSSPIIRQPTARRTARVSWAGSTTRSAPSRRARSC